MWRDFFKTVGLGLSMLAGGVLLAACWVFQHPPFAGAGERELIILMTVLLAGCAFGGFLFKFCQWCVAKTLS